MDLIDRYLITDRRHLPPALQRDIIEELADSLRSEAEDRARQLARPLAEADQAELLKKHGHPWLMASRYLPQQHLVGPALYPCYRRALTFEPAPILAVTLRAGHWTTVVAGPAFAARAASVERGLNLSIQVTLIVIVVITLYETLWELWQMAKARREAWA